MVMGFPLPCFFWLLLVFLPPGFSFRWTLLGLFCPGLFSWWPGYGGFVSLVPQIGPPSKMKSGVLDVKAMTSNRGSH